MSHLPMSSQTRSLSVPDGDSLYLMMIISNVVFPFLELKIETEIVSNLCICQVSKICNEMSRPRPIFLHFSTKM